MPVLYPQFSCQKIGQNGQEARIWEGRVRPLLDDDEAQLVIADLDADRCVDVLVCGRVRHRNGCDGPHNLRAELGNIERLDAAYTLRVFDRHHTGHPRVQVIQPIVSKKIFPNHQHIYTNGVICPFLPSEGHWKPEDHGLARYLDFVMEWLVKHTVWVRTRERDGPGNGIWIGSVHRHTPQYHVANIRPSSRCWCGLPRRYGDCHLREDLAEVHGRPSPVRRAEIHK